MDASVPEVRRQALRIRRYILRLIKAGKAGQPDQIAEAVRGFLRK